MPKTAEVSSANSVVSRKMVLQTVETAISARSLRWRSRTRERTSLRVWALRLK